MVHLSQRVLSTGPEAARLDTVVSERHKNFNDLNNNNSSPFAHMNYIS